MIDWPVAAGNLFVGTSLVALLVAPVSGAATPATGLSRRTLVATIVGLIALACVLGFGWRSVPGGPLAALTGPLALTVGVWALRQIGRLIGSAMTDDLGAALAGLAVAVSLTIGPFALGPGLDGLSAGQSARLLMANPLVTATNAAGIDLLHLDLVYQLSPLAHRGVALPSWMALSLSYALVGLAALGSSRFLPRSR